MFLSLSHGSGFVEAVQYLRLIDEVQSVASDDLDGLYVKIRYHPPKNPVKPTNCKSVTFSKAPEITAGLGASIDLHGLHPSVDEPIGISFHRALLDSEGVGAVHLILQVSTYIEWETEFVSAAMDPRFCPAPVGSTRLPGPRGNQIPPRPFDEPAVGRMVREKHRVYVSIPVMYTVTGPDVFISVFITKAFKDPTVNLRRYIVKIMAAFKQLEQVDEVIQLLFAFKKGFCPEDIDNLERRLKTMEKSLNDRLERERLRLKSRDSEGGLIKAMRLNPSYKGRFASVRPV